MIGKNIGESNKKRRGLWNEKYKNNAIIHYVI